MPRKPRDPSGYSLGPEASRTVASRLKGFMDSKGVSQAALARASGIPQGHISDLLSGRRRFQRWQILAFADALGVTEDDFVIDFAITNAVSIAIPASQQDEAKKLPEQTLQQFLDANAYELAPADVDALTAFSIALKSPPVVWEAGWWIFVEVFRQARRPVPIRFPTDLFAKGNVPEGKSVDSLKAAFDALREAYGPKKPK